MIKLYTDIIKICDINLQIFFSQTILLIYNLYMVFNFI